MSRKKVKKFYAIKDGKGVKNKIVNSWEECKELVHGYPAIYKSFITKDEAEVYLDNIKDKEIEGIREKNSEAREYKTKRKRSTTYLKGIRLENNLYNEFEEKCEKMGYKQEKIISLLIKEWLI